MESPEVEGNSNLSVMPPSDRTSESSRLVPPNTAPKPSYMNIISNICALILLIIIISISFINGIKLFSFHPICMIIGWVVIIPSAINAITPGDLATEWMPMRLRSARHWVLQVLAGIMILIGFIIIVTNKIISEKDHFVSIHGKFGLASFILLFGTKIGGLGALYSLQLKHYLAPIYIKLLHASAGLITFSIATITIILAFFSNWWQFGDTLRYISLILVLLVMLLTVLRPSLKIYFRLKERLENAN